MAEAAYRELLKKKSSLFSLKVRLSNIDNLLRKHRLTQRQVDFIKKAYELMDSIYPGNCDIQFGLKADMKDHINQYGDNQVKHFKIPGGIKVSTIYLVIRFPKFTITNENQREHCIYDLFVRIPVGLETDSQFDDRWSIFPASGFKFRHIEGSRIKHTVAELFSDYTHSHSPGVQLATWATFCTGDGDIDNVLSLLNCEDHIDYDLLKLLLLEIDPFVKWESIEGSPYRFMSNIGIKDYNDIHIKDRNIGIHNSIEIFATFKWQFRRASIGHFNNLKLDWIFSGGSYKLLDNDNFDELLENVLRGIYPSYFYQKDIDGRYYKLTDVDSRNTSVTVRDYTDNPKPFVFQNQILYSEVIDEGSNQASNRYYLHPKLKKYVKYKLEYYANLSQVKARGVNYLNTSNSSR